MNESPETRASLLIRIRHHDDADAWAEFLEIYQPLIRQMARRYGLQDADTTEVTQEVLTRAAKAVAHWETSGRQGSFRGWLNRVTKNLVIQYFRDRRRIPQPAHNSDLRRAIENKMDAATAGDEEFDLELQRQMFAWAARKVEPRFEPATWSAFWRTAVEHQPIELVAAQLNMTRGAIYVARSRVMSAISKTIEQRMAELEDVL
jgi:RNA polymerase sigma-70 factor (ECF subfamily)